MIYERCVKTSQLFGITLANLQTLHITRDTETHRHTPTHTQSHTQVHTQTYLLTLTLPRTWHSLSLSFSPFLSLFLSLSLTHTHTNRYTQTLMGLRESNWRTNDQCACVYVCMCVCVYVCMCVCVYVCAHAPPPALGCSKHLLLIACTEHQFKFLQGNCPICSICCTVAKQLQVTRIVFDQKSRI